MSVAGALVKTKKSRQDKKSMDSIKVGLIPKRQTIYKNTYRHYNY